MICGSKQVFFSLHHWPQSCERCLFIENKKMISDITNSKSVLYGATAAAGFLAIGYLLGKRQITSWKKIVTKSYENEDAVKSYCVKHSTPITDIQSKLIEFTLKMPRGQMLGAPEVISLNSALIMALKAKKVLDIGVFTGASSLGKKCLPVAIFK